MPLSRTNESSAGWRYGVPAVVLHWLIAALIVFLVTLGWWMMTIERTPQGPWWFDLHRSFGLVATVLIVLRLLWRAGHRPEALPATMPRWQARLAELTQWLLYACMVVMPVTGILGTLHSRDPGHFFGIPLAPLAQDRALRHLMFEIHSTTVWVLVGLVALHVIGALKHALVDRDAVFRRMWFG